jgi:hypothetical protein
MTDRIERIDARFALAPNSEMNYQTVNDEKEAERQRCRRKIQGCLVIIALMGYVWLLVWKVAQGL